MQRNVFTLPIHCQPPKFLQQLQKLDVIKQQSTNMDPHNKNRECINEFWKQSYRKFYVPLKKMDSGEE